jgi:hypothetical protein
VIDLLKSGSQGVVQSNLIGIYMHGVYLVSLDLLQAEKVRNLN